MRNPFVRGAKSVGRFAVGIASLFASLLLFIALGAYFLVAVLGLRIVHAGPTPAQSTVLACKAYHRYEDDLNDGPATHAKENQEIDFIAKAAEYGEHSNKKVVRQGATFIIDSGSGVSTAQGERYAIAALSDFIKGCDS